MTEDRSRGDTGVGGSTDVAAFALATIAPALDARPAETPAPLSSVI
jgi:hypothetical protein